MSGTLFDLPCSPDSSTCKQSLQVAIAGVLAKHGKSYNTDRSGVGYVVCRCGLEMRLDGSTGADDARTLAAHQSEKLMLEARIRGLMVSPDCRDGNCRKCDGAAWDEAKDEPAACQCRDLTHGAIGDPHEN